MNALHFLEVKQDGHIKPEDPPVLPILVGKVANQGLPSVDIERSFGKVEPQSSCLKQQKHCKYG